VKLDCKVDVQGVMQIDRIRHKRPHLSNPHHPGNRPNCNVADMFLLCSPFVASTLPDVTTDPVSAQ